MSIRPSRAVDDRAALEGRSVYQSYQAHLPEAVFGSDVVDRAGLLAPLLRLDPAAPP